MSLDWIDSLLVLESVIEKLIVKENEETESIICEWIVHSYEHYALHCISINIQSILFPSVCPW